MKTPIGLQFIYSIIVAFIAAIAVAAEQETPKPAAAPVKHVDAKQAKVLVDEKKVVVLDVRTPEEFKEGHIAGATNINFQSPDFAKRISELNKDATYLVHCAAGGRSTRCLPVLQKQQIKSIVHLDGGLSAWEKAGLPVEK